MMYSFRRLTSPAVLTAGLLLGCGTDAGQYDVQKGGDPVRYVGDGGDASSIDDSGGAEPDAGILPDGGGDDDGCVPSDEVCNGADDDCDGEVDEDFATQTCGQGACEVIVEVCVDGEPKTCEPGDPAPTEACDGVDDDCDGEIDEECQCIDGEEQDCYPGPMATRGVGECSDGTQTCTGGAFGACQGAVLPRVETCDGIDNDCDGFEDEGNPGGGAACDTGRDGTCSAGTETCVNGAIECRQDEMPSPETCNGVDDDCDGLTDEGDPGGGASCDSGQLGACAPGTETCQNGAIACVQDKQPITELCNGIDDDCDGQVDDGNPGGGASCNTGLQGVCSSGTETCVMGQIECVQDAQSSPETCGDNLDNDCNGQVDENCCAHDRCVSGGPLTATCDPCVNQICNNDPFCCSDTWDHICQQQVYTVCGLSDCGTCTDAQNPASSGCQTGHHCQPQTQVSSPGLCLDPTGGGGQYSLCTDLGDCAPGYNCVNVGTNVYCLRWCTSSAQCPGIYDSCVSLSPSRYINGQEWGVCYDGFG